jgi:cell division inhibitor SulA
MEELTGEIQKGQGGVFMSVCRRQGLPSNWQNQDSTGESSRLAGWLLKLWNSTSINLVPAMKPGGSKSYCARFFFSSWSCLYFRSSCCIGSELYI